MLSLFGDQNLVPHGYCLAWDPGLVWLHISSDTIITVSYYSIPVVLAAFVSRRPDIAFGWVFWAFAVFILACGTTHLFGIWTLFVPDYWAEGIVKAVTALASIGTAIGLLPLFPKALALPSPEQLRKANGELERQIALYEQTLTELRREKEEREKLEAHLRQRQKMEAIGELTAGLAHEFNNVLTIVAGSIHRARRQLTSSSDPIPALDTAAAGVQRAANLVHRLLAFGRQQPLSATEFDVNEVVEQAAETLRPILGEGITLIVNAAPSPLTVKAEVPELQGALINLALNARHAMSTGGNLVLSVRRLSQRDAGQFGAELAGKASVEIAVTDTGSGMSDDVRQRAFEPFFTTKPVGEGSGLGLSQVYGFARQSGGLLLIDSKPGEGTTVRILLPLAEAESVAKSVPAVAVRQIKPA